MKKIKTILVWPIFVFMLLALPFTTENAFGDYWQNYFEKPNIVYDLAVETCPYCYYRYYVWAATGTGVFKINASDGSYIRYTYADGLSSNSVKSIMIDSSRKKWFGTMLGELDSFDGSAWTAMVTTDPTPINGIAMDGSGRIWLAKGGFASALAGLGGVHIWDGSNWTIYNTTNSGLLSNYVEALVIDSSGNVWMGCPPPPLGVLFGQPGGMNMFDGSTWTSYGKAQGLAEENVYDIAIDTSGTKWIATLFGGVSRFDGSTWTTYNTGNSGLPNNNVESVAASNNGDLWFGTTLAGVAGFDGSTWTIYDTSNSGLVNNNIHSIAIYETSSCTSCTRYYRTRREIWLGTGNGVSRYNTRYSTWRTYQFDGILNTIHNAVAVDGSGNKWLATKSGLTMFDGSTWTVYDTSNSGIAGDNVQAVAVAPGGTVWFGTKTGAGSFDGSTWTAYDTSNSGISSNNVQAVAVASDGTVWFGTDAGISVFDGSIWTAYDVAGGSLIDDNIRSIAIDSDGTVWAGTYKGASRLKSGSWTNFSRGSGIADPIVRSVAIDGSGNAWFATGNGVSAYMVTDGSDTSSGSPSTSLPPVNIDLTQPVCFIGSLAL